MYYILCVSTPHTTINESVHIEFYRSEAKDNSIPLNSYNKAYVKPRT